jgi:hypothetical protein
MEVKGNFKAGKNRCGSDRALLTTGVLPGPECKSTVDRIPYFS